MPRQKRPSGWLLHSNQCANYLERVLSYALSWYPYNRKALLAQRCPCTSYDDLLCCCSKPTSAIICSDYMQQYLDITKSLYSMCSSSYRTPLSPKVLPTRGGAIFAALHLRQIAKHFLLTASRDNNRQTPSMSNTPPLSCRRYWLWLCFVIRFMSSCAVVIPRYSSTAGGAVDE